MNQPLIEGDARIRRRWLIGIALFAATGFLLLWPLANALFGLPGKAPDSDAQANRLVYEELVKLVLVLGVAALAAWLGVKTLATRTFPPAGMRVPVRMSVNRGAGALVPGHRPASWRPWRHWASGSRRCGSRWSWPALLRRVG